MSGKCPLPAFGELIPEGDEFTKVRQYQIQVEDAGLDPLLPLSDIVSMLAIMNKAYSDSRLLRFIFFSLILLSTNIRCHARSDDTPFREHDLQKLLNKNPITGLPVDSIRELVPLLPQELRENFTLVYDSRSPFRSNISADYPRVILFSQDARLVLTFIGDERTPASELLETMSFNDKSAKFELRSYLLPAAKRKGWQPPPEAANCSRCHGSDPRPIYDSYPVWPGFYGAALDTFPPDRIGVAELRKFERFLEKFSNKGVYASLVFKAQSPVGPYLDPRLFSPDERKFNSEKFFSFSPNFRLGIALTELNRKRIFRKLAEGKYYKANEKLLLAELLDCGPSDTPSRTLMTKISKQLRQETKERQKRMKLLPEDPKRHWYEMAERLYLRGLAQIKSVAARAGADMSDWSMALEPGSLSFYDGILSGSYNNKHYYLKEDLIFEMLAHLSKREAAFRPYFASYNVYEQISGKSSGIFESYPFGHRIDLEEAVKSCSLLLLDRKN